MSLVGYSPWSCEESDMTEQLHFHALSCIGEGNGNPLQRSCLENLRARVAWWVAVYGVVQSRTWLKWLSRSSKTIKAPALCRGTSDGCPEHFTRILWSRAPSPPDTADFLALHSSEAALHIPLLSPLCPIQPSFAPIKPPPGSPWLLPLWYLPSDQNH